MNFLTMKPMQSKRITGSNPALNKYRNFLAVAFELCDAAVNIGPHHPCTWLQRWLNVMNREQQYYPDIKADGSIGPQTLHALNSYLSQRGKEGEAVLVKALNCSRALIIWISAKIADKMKSSFTAGLKPSDIVEINESVIKDSRMSLLLSDNAI